MYCVKCGTKIDESLRYCSVCSEELNPKGIFKCKICDKNILVGWKYCKYCGHQVCKPNKEYISDFRSGLEKYNLKMDIFDRVTEQILEYGPNYPFKVGEYSHSSFDIETSGFISIKEINGNVPLRYVGESSFMPDFVISGQIGENKIYIRTPIVVASPKGIYYAEDEFIKYMDLSGNVQNIGKAPRVIDAYFDEEEKDLVTLNWDWYGLDKKEIEISNGEEIIFEYYHVKTVVKRMLLLSDELKEIVR